MAMKPPSNLCRKETQNKPISFYSFAVADIFPELSVFRKQRRWPKFVVAAVFMAAVLGLYAFWYEPASLSAVTYAMNLDEPNKIASTPLRIAVISDLHAGAPYIGEDKIDRIVQLTNEAKPDLILLTGDYVIDDVL